MKKLLKSYLKRLTNLSAGNKSLMQLRLYQGQDLDVKTLEFLLKDQDAFHILEKLISSTQAFKIAQILDSRDASNNEASKILKSIARKNKLIFDERGVHDLYLGWPFVQGKMIDGTPIRCPLLFFSVELSENNNFWMLKRSANAPVSWNRSFLLAYSYYNKVSFSDSFLETNLEDFSSDSLLFRNELYALLKDSELEINFNRDLFENKIEPFFNLKRPELEQELKLGELKLLPHAVLGIYPQSGSYLVPDYETMIAQLDDNQTVDSFFEDRDCTDLDRNFNGKNSFSVKEEQTFTPFALDASQENALKAVKAGKSVVVQGPPGTGKSQLICNMVADYTARGKKVLVVCQKKVALEVVASRLGQVGLSDFSVLLHDFKNDRKSIYTQIEHQIERLESYELENNKLDSIYLDRNFLKTSREIDHISEELAVFKTALFDTQTCGISVKEMYLNSNPLLDTIDLEWCFKTFQNTEIQEFTRLLAALYPYKKKFSSELSLTQNRKSFAGLTSLDKSKILSYLPQIQTSYQDFSQEISRLFSLHLTFGQIKEIASGRIELEHLTRQIAKPSVYSLFKKFYESKPNFGQINTAKNKITSLFAKGIEQTIPTDKLAKTNSLLIGYQMIESNFLKSLCYKFFDSNYKIVSKLFADNRLQMNGTGLKELQQKIANRFELEKIKDDLAKKLFIVDLPANCKKQEFDAWFEDCKLAQNSYEQCAKFDFLKPIFTTEKHRLFSDSISKISTLCLQFSSKSSEWMAFFSEEELASFSQNTASNKSYTHFIQENFEDLCAYDQMILPQNKDQKQIVDLLFAKEASSLKDIQYLFVNSMYLHWINAIEAKYPILRAVSSLEMQKKEAAIRESFQLKMNYSKDIVLQKVRENTYKNVAYNRLQNRTTYRELEHQVTKQRRIWPLRQVMNEFSDEVLDLIPCWLASPEAVSAVFPLDFSFDLVIFDEASQCFVEKGIPALYRAKQFVITGDSQQLSPYDLYQVRFEDEQEEDENHLLEIDSLLDVSKNFLLELSLTGHYRSKSLDLIQFSNQHFYKNKLRMTPQKSDFLENKNGFEYQLVEGIWEQNCNQTEADKVVAICMQYIVNEPDKTLGVVCFNYKQQQLVYDKLLTELHAKNLLLPKHIFVKNIENVQGDERDVIIFSLAYAPNKQGKLAMNFGSLNQKGGANRLNVAVTRAKEKNIVVASILPTQLSIEDAKNEGPKLLKAFLEYAFGASKNGYSPDFKGVEASNLNWLLKQKIKEIGGQSANYQLFDTYYFADILAKSPDNVHLLLTDDDLYFASLGVKESHLYLPLLLESKNWSFEQVYSRNYWAKQKIESSL